MIFSFYKLLPFTVLTSVGQKGLWVYELWWLSSGELCAVSSRELCWLSVVEGSHSTGGSLHKCFEASIMILIVLAVASSVSTLLRRLICSLTHLIEVIISGVCGFPYLHP